MALLLHGKTLRSPCQTSSMSACSFSLRNPSEVIWRNDLVCSDSYSSGFTFNKLTRCSSQPKSSWSHWLPHSLHLDGPRFMPIPRSCSPLHPHWYRRRLLLPRNNCNGNCWHWGIHSGQQYDLEFDALPCLGVLILAQPSHLRFSSSMEHTGARWPTTRILFTKSPPLLLKKVVLRAPRTTLLNASTISRCAWSAL